MINELHIGSFFEDFLLEEGILNEVNTVVLKSVYEWMGVNKTAGVMGGEACIRNTRIPVWLLVSYRQQGMSEREILEAYPDLSATDLVNAWKYAHANTGEITDAIQKQEKADELIEILAQDDKNVIVSHENPNLLDSVAILKPIPAERLILLGSDYQSASYLPSGLVGTIVEIRQKDNENYYLVEFADSYGCEYAMTYLKANEFIVLQNEIVAA